jgi:GNAT superfamily N-acetyltransferase
MLEYVGLSRRPLQTSFRINSGARARILEYPGRWMPEAEREQLLRDLRAVVAGSIERGSLSYGVLTGERAAWERAVLTIIYADGAPVAFNALSVLPCELRGRPVDVLHLGLALVRSDYRGRGLSSVLYGLTCFLMFARRQLRPLWISNVTQVPAVFGLVGEYFEEVFPSAKPGARRSYDHLVLAREIMRKHRVVFGVGPEAGFDEARFVITDSYTGGSDNLKKRFEDAQASRLPAFNDMCRRELDYERGDDFLQIGRWGLKTTKEYFVRTAPRISPASLAVQFGFLALQSLVAPLLHWLRADQPMEDLRPWGTPGT